MYTILLYVIQLQIVLVVCSVGKVNKSLKEIIQLLKELKDQNK